MLFIYRYYKVGNVMKLDWSVIISLMWSSTSRALLNILQTIWDAQAAFQNSTCYEFSRVTKSCLRCAHWLLRCFVYSALPDVAVVLSSPLSIISLSLIDSRNVLLVNSFIIFFCQIPNWGWLTRHFRQIADNPLMNR